MRWKYSFFHRQDQRNLYMFRLTNNQILLRINNPKFVMENKDIYPNSVTSNCLLSNQQLHPIFGDYSPPILYGSLVKRREIPCYTYGAEYSSMLGPQKKLIFISDNK